MRPQGIAVTRDGRYVVVSTFWGQEVLLLDGETYETVASVPTSNPWGVSIPPQQDRVVVGGKRGITAFGLPAMNLLFYNEVRARSVVIPPAGDHYLTSGHVPGREFLEGALVRIDNSGRVEARRRLDVSDNTAYVLSPDGSEIAAFDGCGSLHVFETTALLPRRRFQFDPPIPCWVVVPLQMPGKLLVVGEANQGDHAVPAGTVVDYRTGMVEPTQRLATRRRNRLIDFGYGNPWASLEDGRAVVASSAGLILVDLATGRLEGVVENVPFLDDSDYCCEVAYDAVRSRLIVVINAGYEPGPDTGRLIVYENR
jgi:hypothetical protein